MSLTEGSDVVTVDLSSKTFLGDTEAEWLGNMLTAVLTQTRTGANTDRAISVKEAITAFCHGQVTTPFSLSVGDYPENPACAKTGAGFSFTMWSNPTGCWSNTTRAWWVEITGTVVADEYGVEFTATGSKVVTVSFSGGETTELIGPRALGERLASNIVPALGQDDVRSLAGQPCFREDAPMPTDEFLGTVAATPAPEA